MTCPHGFPSRLSCVECMAEGPVVSHPRWQKVGGVFGARYEGVCRDCREPVLEGTAVQRWDRGDEETAYLHIGCLPT